MKKLIFIITLVFISFILTSSAFAQPCRTLGAGQKMQKGGGSVLPCGVSLSQSQLASMNSLRTEFLKETLPLRSKITSRNYEKKLLLLEASPEEKALLKLQKGISALKAQISEKQLVYQLKARKLLTLDQIAQLPPGCNLGFGKRNCGPGVGMGSGCGMGQRSGRSGCR